MFKKAAIVEKMYHYGTNPAFLCEDIFTSKPKLQQYLDMLACYGTVEFTDYDGKIIDVKTIWGGKSTDFGFIKYTEKTTIFKYRVRMKELDRVH